MNDCESCLTCRANVELLGLFCFGIFHVEEDTIQVLLGCEDGNNDGGVAGEVLPLWYSLKEVIKVPEQADRATSQGRNVTTFTIDLLKTCRQTEKRLVVNVKHFPFLY